MSKDKRRYPRVEARNVSAHLNVADKSSPCTIQNISAGGVFIETSAALPVGMPVSVNLARPGWTSVLRLTGRVVWAIAERTAAKKGTVPGMRIKFDPLSKAIADGLVLLLTALGAPDSPLPPIAGDELKVPAPGDLNVITQPVSAHELKAKVGASDVYPRVVRDDSTLPPRSAVSTILNPAYRPLSAPKQVPAIDAPRLVVQVQGLLMQLGELQSQLEARDRELAALQEKLRDRDDALQKAERERRAAELAVQRLSMQLQARR